MYELKGTGLSRFVFIVLYSPSYELGFRRMRRIMIKDRRILAHGQQIRRTEPIDHRLDTDLFFQTCQ